MNETEFETMVGRYLQGREPSTRIETCPNVCWSTKIPPGLALHRTQVSAVRDR